MAARQQLEVGAALPRRGWCVGRALGSCILRLAGWRLTGEIPNLSKAVIIVGPHTSNWDFVIGAAGMLALDLDIRFLGKHTLFEGPLAPIMRALGGIPVDRTRSGGGVVEAMAEAFGHAEQLLLALSPEGTRKAVSRWKTGFHRIARAAGVPIAAVALDYGRREIRFGPVRAAGDVESDMAVFRGFFGTARGRRDAPAVPAA